LPYINAKYIFPVLLILIVAAIFVVWWNPAEKLSYDSVDEVYYKEYMDK
jgi:hypothetical protein